MKYKQNKQLFKNVLILTFLLFPLLFVHFCFSSVYSKENSSNRNEKLNSKLTKIEKSNLDENTKLEKTHTIYKKLAINEPEEYLTQYLKNSYNLASYYGQIGYRINAIVCYKETIQTYEKIISKNSQLVNKEAIPFYKGLSTYYNSIHQPSTCIKFIEDGLKQTNYLLEKNPNDTEVLKLKSELLRWYLITSISYDVKSGHLNRCLDMYQQAFETDKKLILNGAYATRALTMDLAQYSLFMKRNGTPDIAMKKYDEYITYFKELSVKNPKYEKNYADLLISKNSEWHETLSEKEIDYNFSKAKSILIKTYDLSTVDGMDALYRDLRDISNIYVANHEYQKAEDNMLQGLDIYNKYTYSEMEKIPYLKYRYLNANADLIKFYKRNRQENKADKLIIKFKDACSYFAQNDEKHIRQMESCNNILMGHYYYFN